MCTIRLRIAIAAAAFVLTSTPLTAICQTQAQDDPPPTLPPLVATSFAPTGDHPVPLSAEMREEAQKSAVHRSGLQAPSHLNRVPPEPRTTRTIDSEGRDFWVCFQHNFADDGTELFLFLTCDIATTANVEVLSLGISEDVPVNAGEITTIVIPSPENVCITSSGIVEQKGIHITCPDEISVYCLNQQDYTTDAYLALPVDILNTDYLVMSYRSGSSNYNESQFAVVSPYDGTVVTITPTAPTEGGHAAGVPFSVTLNEGDVVQIRDGTSSGDLTGSLIQASAPVSVFGGHSCANVPPGVPYCDHLVEQIPPLSTWGTEFVTSPLEGRQGGDTYRILSSQNGTVVSINGVSVATLDFADYYECMLDEPSYVESNNPILLAQFSNGDEWDPDIPGNGDPFMMLVPPYEQFLGDYVFATPAAGFPTNYVAVTAHEAVVPTLSLDGSPVNPGDFTQVPGTLFTEGALPVSVGVHSVTSSTLSNFGIYSYGFKNDDSYGYLGGLSLGTIQSGGGPVIARTASTIELGQSAQPAGADLDLTFHITDPEFPYTQSAWLHYRMAGGVQYTSVSLSEEYGDLWTGTIPGSEANEPGVQYYVSASDGQVSTWNPPVNPTSNPYSIPVFPNDPPVIDHTPVASTEPGSPVEITALVRDETEYLTGVELCYRVSGGNPAFARLPMSPQGGDTYGASIPSSVAAPGVGIEYYLEATDSYSVSTFHGQPDSPHFISVYVFDEPETPFLRFWLTEAAGHMATTVRVYARRYARDRSDSQEDISTLTLPVERSRDGRHSSFVFDEDELRDLMEAVIDWKDIYRFDLEDGDGDCIGHMSFGYREEDFNSDSHDGRGRDVFIFLHNDLPEGRLQKYDDAKPGTWNYYADGEYQMSMLIPPDGRFDRMAFGNEPAIFVHGVNGSAPYWGSADNEDGWKNSITEQLDHEDYDAWEFYYPLDQQIRESGRLLGRAVGWLLHGDVLGQMHYQSNAVSLVAHSMGGLVSRSHLQSDDYDGNVNRLFMFATPNHGSLGAWRIYYGDLPDELARLFGKQDSDDHAPAFSDLSPASGFLWELNASEPRQLLASSDRADEYLVLAGTKPHALSALHHEIRGQHDGVVAVASASLLEYGLPLCTRHEQHNDTRRSQDGLVILREFLTPTFRHDSPGFLSRVDSYWLDWDNNVDSGQLPSGVDLDKGSFWFALGGLADDRLMEHYDVSRDGSTLRIEENTWEIYYSGPGILRHSDTRTYYSMNKPTVTVREIGVDFPPQDYQLVMGRIDHTWGFPVFMAYCSFVQPLPFKDRQTTMADLDIDNSMLTIANANSQYPMNNNLVIVLGGARNRSADVTVSIDPSVAAATFYTRYDDTETNDYSCYITLERPAGTVVDSLDAHSSPNMDYVKSRSFDYEYFSIQDPEQGEWTLRIHAVDTGTGVLRAYPTAYFDSEVSIAISLPDSSGSAGEGIDFTVALCAPPAAEVDEIEATLWYAPSNDHVLEFVSVIELLDAGDMRIQEPSGLRGTNMEGEFAPHSPGFYHIRCILDGELAGTSFTRIAAAGVVIPQLGPASESTLDNDGVYFFPNPFNPEEGGGTLRYRLAHDGLVSIRIYDTSGTLVKTVVQNENRDAGIELAEHWDGKNEAGTTVANGVYLYVIESSSSEKGVGKIAVLR